MATEFTNWVILVSQLLCFEYGNNRSNLKNAPLDLMWSALAVTKTEMPKQEHAVEMMEWVFNSIKDTP